MGHGSLRYREKQRTNTIAGASEPLAQLKAIKEYSKQFDHETAFAVSEAWLMWVRHMGGLLAEVPRSTAGRHKKNTLPEVTYYEKTLDVIHITRKTAAEWRKASKVPDKVFRQHISTSAENRKLPSLIGLLKDKTDAAKSDRRKKQADAEEEALTGFDSSDPKTVVLTSKQKVIQCDAVIDPFGGGEGLQLACVPNGTGDTSSVTVSCVRTMKRHFSRGPKWSQRSRFLGSMLKRYF